jgi:hypothetical protein
MIRPTLDQGWTGIPQTPIDVQSGPLEPSALLYGKQGLKEVTRLGDVCGGCLMRRAKGRYISEVQF